MSDQPANLAAALAAFQADLPSIPKASKGNRGKYADIADLSPIVLPKLAAQGLSWSCKPTYDDTGKFVLRYTLRHISGEVDTGDYGLPDPSEGSQAIGSAITYSRRYALCAVTGVAPHGEDDDGEESRTTSHNSQRQTRTSTPAQRRASPEANGEAKPTKEDLEKRAAAAVTTMLAAKTVDDAEKMVSRAFNSPAKDIRCDGLLTPEQREVLGMTGDPHNLHDLAQTVLAYVEKHNRSVDDALVPA